MIKYIEGDVLELCKTGIIVHGCNAQGVMGSGIAAQIKAKHPGAFKLYASSPMSMGDISVYAVNDGKFIVNAITQEYTGYGKQVSYDAVDLAFKRINDYHKNTKEFFNGGDLPICFPKIGAGLGGGNWEIIEKIIDVNLTSPTNKICFVLQ